MIIMRPRPMHVAISVLLLLCVGIFFKSSTGTTLSSFKTGLYSTSSDINQPWLDTYRGQSIHEDINRVTNKTLGFSKVFVIGLPERSDKRDAISLTAALTGFQVEWVDGIKGESIPDKAVPFGVNRKKLMETNLGSWRGHMNAVRRIIEEGLESALILEDDMDWDVRLRQQLESIATGARVVSDSVQRSLHPGSDSQSSDYPVSPYGEAWDLLWLGHCGEPFPESLSENKALLESDRGLVAMSQKYTIHPDPTVPPPDKVTGIVHFKDHEPQTRWVHVTAAPICSFAYALSQRGARKVMQDLSVDRLKGPVDNALASLCRRAVGSWSTLANGQSKTAKERGYDMQCLSVTPPLFFHHRAKGNTDGDSDIQGSTKDTDSKQGENDKNKKKGQIREKGMTENIMWSARLNIENLLTGQQIESQF